MNLLSDAQTLRRNASSNPDQKIQRRRSATSTAHGVAGLWARWKSLSLFLASQRYCAATLGAWQALMPKNTVDRAPPTTTFRLFKQKGRC
ncbi:MAG: hypothetical protein WA303_15930, partial [Bradyrhizobium sp.]